MTPAQRRRALVNRAIALHTLGRLTEAKSTYQAILQDRVVSKQMTAQYRMAFVMSMEAVRWQLGESIDLKGLDGAVPDLGRAPITWSAYWWILSHVAWRDFPARLEGIRMSSHHSFGHDWDLHYDRVLWGVDLFLSVDTDTETVAENRVRTALWDPETVAVVGRASWFELYGDWLYYWAVRDPAIAVGKARELVQWCDHYGYNGWSERWVRRLLDPESSEYLLTRDVATRGNCREDGRAI